MHLLLVRNCLLALEHFLLLGFVQTRVLKQMLAHKHQRVGWSLGGQGFQGMLQGFVHTRTVQKEQVLLLLLI